MLCHWEGSSIEGIGAALTCLAGRHHGLIVGVVLELVDFELALSFDLRHYSAGSVERGVNVLMKLERQLFKEDQLISEANSRISARF